MLYTKKIKPDCNSGVVVETFSAEEDRVQPSGGSREEARGTRTPSSRENVFFFYSIISTIYLDTSGSVRQTGARGKST